jgi:hypothetical protein
MSKSYMEARTSAAELSVLISEVVEENCEGKSIGEVASALLSVLGFYVGKCPPALRQEMMCRFRRHLLDSLEKDIEDSALIHNEISGVLWAVGGEA